MKILIPLFLFTFSEANETFMKSLLRKNVKERPNYLEKKKSAGNLKLIKDNRKKKKVFGIRNHKPNTQVI